MVSQLCLLFGLIPDWVLIVVALIVFLLVMLFVPIVRPIFAVLFFGVVLVSGIFATYYDIRHFTIKGHIYGNSTEGQHNQTICLFDGINKFKYERLGFSSTGVDNEYSCKQNFQSTLALADNDIFYLNDAPFITTDKQSDYGEFIYDFFSDGKEVMCSDTLYCTLYLYANSMELELKTKGGDDAVKFWKRYLAKNEMTISLQSGDIPPTNNGIEIDDNIRAVYIDVTFSERAIKQSQTPNPDYATSSTSGDLSVIVLLYQLNDSISYSFRASPSNSRNVYVVYDKNALYMISFVNLTGYKTTIQTGETMGLEAINDDNKTIIWHCYVDVSDTE